MNIDRNNPETWNRPGWEALSCYANSALWALLYNNVYIDLISYTSVIPNANFNIVDSELEIKTSLLDFHDAINSNQRINNRDVYSYTKTIRNNLFLITKNNEWNSNPMDPVDFLMAISQIFENVNNCVIDNNLLPLIKPGDLNINAYGKTVTFNMFGENKSCNFNRSDGLIVQYGDGRDVIFEEKYYSIGKYKLYAFLHYIDENHYSCYFEFNNEWYNFDDWENGHQGRIIKVQRVKRKTIYNHSFLFFYKIDETILSQENVTLTEYFNRDDRTLSIVDDDEPVANQISSSFRFTSPTSSEKLTYSFQPQPQIQPQTKNWLKIFNRCNDIKEELSTVNPLVVVTPETVNPPPVVTQPVVTPEIVTQPPPVVMPERKTHYKTIEDVDEAIRNLYEESQSEVRRLNKEYEEEKPKYEYASGIDEVGKKILDEKHTYAVESIKGKAKKTFEDLKEIRRKIETQRKRGTPEAIIKKRQLVEEGTTEKRGRSEGGTKRNKITKCKLSKKNSNYNKYIKSRKYKKTRKCKKTIKNIN